MVLRRKAFVYGLCMHVAYFVRSYCLLAKFLCAIHRRDLQMVFIVNICKNVE